MKKRKCPKCGYLNPKKKQFCEKCGFNVVLYFRKDVPIILGGFTKGTPAGYFRHEKTGRMIPVDKRGNVMESDPYYEKGDPRGWKRAGKSTEGYKRKVHFDEEAGKFK